MADDSFHIATDTQLNAHLAELQKSSVRAERHFADQLGGVLYDNVGRADLGTVTGRILRSCVFDVFEILRRHCPDEEMLVHMCFVNRHGIDACEGEKITPSKIRIWDGLDELKPQKKYKNDWNGDITSDHLENGLTGGEELKEQVRSFRCYKRSYFEPAGSFVAHLPKTAEDTEIIFMRSSDQVAKEFSPDSGWEGQNDLDSAVLAFSKFVRKQFSVQYPAEGTRSLFLISV